MYGRFATASGAAAVGRMPCRVMPDPAWCFPSSNAGEFLGEAARPHHFDAAREREVFGSGINHEFAIRLQILAGDVKALLDLRRQVSLYLNNPDLPV